MGEQSAPLQGIRILELGHIVAGPSAGLILTELGAQVIKIENPKTGDTGRNMPNKGSTFYFLNRNKQSLALNFKSEEGIEIFKKLVEQFDVVLDNYAPGALNRLGIGYDWAKEINPRIIYCSLKGFLPGPKQSRPILDELAQMEGGLAYMTGPAGQPMRAGASIVDIGAATYGVLGILAAIIQREKTGQGQYVTAGLFETTVFWVGQHISRAQLTQSEQIEPISAKGMGMQMGWGVYRLFPTRDGRKVFIAIVSNHHWDKFCRSFGLEDLLRDPSFENNRKRVEQKDYLAERITQIVEQMDSQTMCEMLEKAGVPFASVNSPADVIDDPQALMNMLELKVPERDGLKVPMLPVRIGDYQYRIRSMPPRLGQHTREILREIGYEDDLITSLVQRNVIREDGPMLRVDGGEEEKQ